MDPKLYKAAKEGDVSCLSGIDGRNITEEEAMRIQDGFFLQRTQHGKNNILHIAARARRDAFVAEALWRFPFLSDQVNSQGDTPLLVAARFGHLQVVKKLAEPNNEPPMQDHDTATAVESGTNSRSSRRQSDVEEGLVDHQLELGTVQDNVATVENGTNLSNISRRQKDVEEGLLDDQLEQPTSLENGTNSRDMTTALENETNSSSGRRPRVVEEGLDDQQLEQGTIQDGMATAMENGTNSRGMATALENETNLSSSRRPRDVEEGLDDHQLEAGTIQDGMATAVENGTNLRDMATVLENVTNSSSRHPRDVEEGLDDHQLEQATAVENGTNSRDMATAPENETNLSSSRRQRDAEEVLVDRQLIHGTTALHEALRNGHEDVAVYLLRLDLEMATLVNGAGESPLFLAAESRCELFMQYILESESESGQRYSTKGPNGLNVLHAARDCSVDIISRLIRVNPDLMRQKDDHGKAAIHYAVEADYWDLVHKMLKEDASIALFPDNDGHTPLLGAASSGHRYFCRDILKICPESIEARNHEGRHALHLCKFRDVRFLMRIPEILELLNEGDEEGNTPLHLAIKENDYEKAMLLASSASIELGAVNKEGLTALDLCQTDWKNTFQQRLIWLHLATHGAPRGRRPIEYKVHVGEWVADYKPLINTMALVAALIATVTFAAAFTMPGGYDTNPDNLGVANLIKIAALKAFIVSDAIAMSCSITAVLTLALSVNGGRELQRRICKMSWVLVGLAMRGTLVAFMCGIFVVIAPKALWVAIFVCIICGIASVAVELSVPILFSPTIIAIIRHRMQQRRYRMQQRRKAMRQIERLRFEIVAIPSATNSCGLLRKLVRYLVC